MMESRQVRSVSHGKLPLIILDSNCRNIHGKLPGMNKLQSWQVLGLIQLRVTEAFYREQDPAGKQSALKFSPIIPEPMILDLESGATNFLDGNCYLADELTLPFRRVAAIMFPGIKELNVRQQNDIMHILAAHRVNAEVFVTDNDKDFIRGGRMERFSELGLCVMNPTDAVAHLQSLYHWA